MMDIEELADLVVSPPKLERAAGLAGTAAVWHFWDYVSHKLSMMRRGADVGDARAIVRHDSFDIDIPGMPGWRRTVSDIEYTPDGCVSDYAISGVKLRDRLMLLATPDLTMTGAARITGDIEVSAIDNRLNDALAKWPKPLIESSLSLDGAAAPMLKCGHSDVLVDKDRIVAVIGMVHLAHRDPATVFTNPLEVSPAQLHEISEITVSARRCSPLRLHPIGPAAPGE